MRSIWFTMIILNPSTKPSLRTKGYGGVGPVLPMASAARAGLRPGLLSWD